MIRPIRLMSPATLALSAAATLAIAVVGGAIVDRLWLALIPATGLLFLAIGALHARWGGDEGRLGVIGAVALRLACIALLATAIAGLVVVAVGGVEPAWLSAPAVVAGVTFMIGEILFGLAAAWRRTAPRGTAILFAIALPLGVAIDFLPRLLTPIPLFFSGAGMNIGLALLALAVARLGWAERRSTLSREDRTAMMKMLSRATGLTIVVGFLVSGIPGNVLAAPICERSSWPVLRSPNRGPSDNELRAVTAVSRKDVWAVGWYVDAATRSNTPLTQHWDGSVWGVVPAAPPGLIGSLQGVDAASSDDVWAVGSSRTELQTSAALAVHWDGTAWKIVEVPAPEAGPFVSMVLTDVEALGPDDVWAVGYWSSVPEAPPSPLIEHWDGRRWEVVDSPDLGTWSELHGVSGTGPDDVWAVGNTEVRVGSDFVERALIEHWDGTAWRLVRAPFVARRSPFTLESVDVRSPADAWAVGQVTRPTAVVTISFHWNGMHWARVPTVNPSEEFQLLGGVAMASRNKVWAVGTYFDAARGQDATLVERWNGRRWVWERSATRRGSSQLFDVAALPSRRFAVGSYWANGGEGPQRTLVLSRCPV